MDITVTHKNRSSTYTYPIIMEHNDGRGPILVFTSARHCVCLDPVDSGWSFGQFDGINQDIFNEVWVKFNGKILIEV